MTKITTKQIKKLRDKTGAGVMKIKKVLEEAKGDEKKAIKILEKHGFEKMEKRSGRVTSQGLVVSYSHHSGKVASLVEVLCETDFVAKNKLFVDLAQNLALQIASMNPKNTKKLVAQDFIKDPKRKISDLIGEVKTKTGENIRIGKFFRVELGEDNG